jgi:FkbM family methyltransferase
LSYNDLLRVRDESVDGVIGWMWITEDDGAWQGPKEDWEGNHKNKWFTHVKTWDYCIQAGGNQGVYPRLLSDRFKIVYTFEPDPLNFHCLVNNNQRDNVVKIQAALGDYHKLIDVQRHSMTNTGMHKVVNGSHVPQFMIDDLELPSLGLIALDIEQYELHAIRGALKTIEKHKPVIVMELPSQETIDMITPFGYREVAQSVSDRVYAVD